MPPSESCLSSTLATLPLNLSVVLSQVQTKHPKPSPNNPATLRGRRFLWFYWKTWVSKLFLLHRPEMVNFLHDENNKTLFSHLAYFHQGNTSKIIQSLQAHQITMLVSYKGTFPADGRWRFGAVQWAVFRPPTSQVSGPRQQVIMWQLGSSSLFFKENCRKHFFQSRFSKSPCLKDNQHTISRCVSFHLPELETLQHLALKMVNWSTFTSMGENSGVSLTSNFQMAAVAITHLSDCDESLSSALSSPLLTPYCT